MLIYISSFLIEISTLVRLQKGIPARIYASAESTTKAIRFTHREPEFNVTSTSPPVFTYDPSSCLASCLVFDSFISYALTHFKDIMFDMTPVSTVVLQGTST